MNVTELVRYLSNFFFVRSRNNTIGGHIYVDTANTYDIGSETHPLHAIYVNNIVAQQGSGGSNLGMVSVIEGDMPRYLVNKLSAGENLSLEVFEEDDGTKRIEISASGGGVFTESIVVEDFSLLNDADVPVIHMERTNGYFKFGAATDIGGIERIDNTVRVQRNGLWPLIGEYHYVSVNRDPTNWSLIEDDFTDYVGRASREGDFAFVHNSYNNDYLLAARKASGWLQLLVG